MTGTHVKANIFCLSRVFLPTLVRPAWQLGRCTDIKLVFICPIQRNVMGVFVCLITQLHISTIVGGKSVKNLEMHQKTMKRTAS